MDFAANLKRAMADRKMTQADLARATGLSTAQVASLVNGKTKDPRLSTVTKIAAALNCSSAELAGEAASHMSNAHAPVDPADEVGRVRTAGEAKMSMAPFSPIEVALSNSMKELVRERDFDEVSVTQICEGAGVSRRTFYRHFLDKFDLMNRTFYHDLCVAVPHHDDWVCWDYMPELCRTFERDRAYYRNAYRVSGLNSFREFATARMHPLLEHDLAGCPVNRHAREAFIVQFFNMVYDNVQDWICNKPTVTADEFAHDLRYHAKVFCTVLAETAAHEPKE